MEQLTNLKSHLQERESLDIESKKVIGKLALLKNLVGQIIDKTAISEELNKLFNSFRDIVKEFRRLHDEARGEITGTISEALMSLPGDQKRTLVIDRDDMAKINNEIFRELNGEFLGILDNIEEKLTKLSQLDANSKEYQEVKQNLDYLLFGIKEVNYNGFFSYKTTLDNNFLNQQHFKKHKFQTEAPKLIKKVFKNGDKDALLSIICDYIEAKFKIDNVELYKDMYEKTKEIMFFLKSLNIVNEISEVKQEEKQIDLGVQIKTLIDEISTMVANKLPEKEQITLIETINEFNKGERNNG
ncbi:MAG: hypothetical protein PHN31_02480 [Candidatus Gracilibacteria bacterium]|nr:hypothetical protein [Candidatus Gracilibacteria bacterium]